MFLHRHTVFVLAFGASVAAAQQPATPTSPASASATPSGPSPLVALRTTLRELVVSEERNYASQQHYTSSIDALKALGLPVLPKVSVTMIQTTDNAYAAAATHADIPGATCVIWVGRPGSVTVPKTAKDGRSGPEGMPTCDDAVAVVEHQRIADMKAAMRNLVVAQEKYWSDHGSYTTDASALGFYPPPKESRRAAMPQVIFAGSRGWSGIMVERGSNTSCVIFIGNPDELPFIPHTVRDRRVASNEGEPLCDVP